MKHSDEAMIDLLHRNCPFDCEAWQLALKLIGWELLPLDIEGRLAGVIMVRDSQIHIAMEPEYRKRCWHKLGNEIRQLFAELIEKFGNVKTVSKNNRNFLERLGFCEVELGHDGTVYYTMEKFRYA